MDQARLANTCLADHIDNPSMPLLSLAPGVGELLQLLLTADQRAEKSFKKLRSWA
jgi:hypothetical protein